MMHQKTILQSISCSGIGVHSGAPVSITLRPAPKDHGIVFQRVDVLNKPHHETLITASWKNVQKGDFCTKLQNQFGQSVSTIEHLMAALAGHGITNILVEVNGPELPIMDGSASPFLFLIECAGLKGQDAPQKIIKILKEVNVKTDYGFASLSPSSGFSAEATITFSGRDGMDAQTFSSKNLQDSFKKDLARARTYGFYSDVEKLKAAGLARGGSLENAVVFDKGDVLNPEGLRFQDECIRHKVLDMVGDLYLAGAPIQGHFKGQNFGHSLNNMLLHELFSDKSAWAEHYEEEKEPDFSYASSFSHEMPSARPAVA
jgi:UDP-3-O-[3-hydroxymyristoyl] N-acetylglucosamine deacetylase